MCETVQYTTFAAVSIFTNEFRILTTLESCINSLNTFKHMRQYEVTFIVDPVLSSDEAKATVKVYTDLLKDNGATIVHIDEMGLRQLAYPINKRNTGVYFCVEFQPSDLKVIDMMELSFRRDERIMRFLFAKLEKYGIKYNEDKRNGLIGKVKKKEEKPSRDDRRGNKSNSKPKAVEAAVKETPAVVAEETPAVVEEVTPEVVVDTTPETDENTKA